MKQLIRLIKMGLPDPIEKSLERFLGIGVAMLLVAPLTMPLYHRFSLMIMFMALGIVYIAYTLYSKYYIVKRGYDMHLFQIYDYTYLSRFARSPSGMRIRSVDGKEYTNYHLAVIAKCGLPEIGTVIIVYVPESAKPKSYGDFHYYPIVLGYETAEYCAICDREY